MEQTNTAIRKITIRERLNNIADRVRKERENTAVRTYNYREENGYFSVSLTPSKKRSSKA